MLLISHIPFNKHLMGMAGLFFVLFFSQIGLAEESAKPLRDDSGFILVILRLFFFFFRDDTKKLITLEKKKKLSSR